LPARTVLVSQRGPLFWHILFAWFLTQQAFAAGGHLGLQRPPVRGGAL